MPNFSNRTAGGFEGWCPWGPLSLRGRESRREVFPSISRACSYLYSTLSPHPPVWPTLPHARIPAEPPGQSSSCLFSLHMVSLPPGHAQATASACPPTHTLLPVSKAPSGKPLDISVVQLFSNCPHQWHLPPGAQAS